jgi:hypothetical protein
MTTSVSTRSPGRMNPTRQQLDELDALLQRMLDLPVNPLDEPEQAEVEEPIDEPLPAAEAPGERPTFADPQEIEQPTDADRLPVQPVTRPTRLPVSYMVVETASPRPLPPASGFEPRQPMPAPRLVPVAPLPETPEPTPVTKEWEVRKVEEEAKGEAEISPPSIPPTPQYTPAPVEPPGQEVSEAEMWVPLRSTWQPSPQTWPPLAESWHHANRETPSLTAPSPLLAPRIDPISAAPLKEEDQEAKNNEKELESEEQTSPPLLREKPQLSLSVEDAPAPVPGLLLPLLWFNQGFDACLSPLGALGRWVCESGRHVLGFVGLACLAAAVVIALSAGMAWTW